MQTRDEANALLRGLSDHVWALTLLGAAAESSMLSHLRQPISAAALAKAANAPLDLVATQLDVLAAIGLVKKDGDRFVASPGLAALDEDLLRWEVRTLFAQSRELVAAARHGRLSVGWSFTDPDILEAQGVFTALAFPMLQKMMLPRLEGIDLAAEGAAFLDVGAGVAAGCLMFARHFPRLRVVGLEPAEAPLALARRNVEAAGLADRVEIRQQRVEDMPDEAAFDFAWFPQVFLPDEVMARGLTSVLRALKPGGWMVTGSVATRGDDLRAALSRARNAMFGGGVRYAEELSAQLREAGFSTVLMMPAPPQAGLQPILARKPL